MATPTEKQRALVRNLAQRKRGDKQGITTAFLWEDPRTFCEAELIPYREATQDQKSQVAAIEGLPPDHFLIRRLSKGDANRVIRAYQEELDRERASGKASRNMGGRSKEDRRRDQET